MVATEIVAWPVLRLVSEGQQQAAANYFNSTPTSSTAAHPANAARPGHPRYPLQDCRSRAIAAPFEAPLARASQTRFQQQRQRGWKLYSVHAPEVECISKGKASAPCGFGVKASIVTTNARAPGDPFVLHAKSLPCNPHDGHTLGAIIECTERLTGCEVECA
jgi:hypothetical protein